MCVCETIGEPSIFRVIRKVTSLGNILTHFDLSQFPDEPVKIKGAHIHYVTSQTY